MSKHPEKFQSAAAFAAYVVPTPVDGLVPNLTKAAKELTKQRVKIKAEQDQAKAAIQDLEARIAKQAEDGKTGKAIADQLAEAAHQSSLVELLNFQLASLSKAQSRVNGHLRAAKRTDADWRAYESEVKHWRREYQDKLNAAEHEHYERLVQPAHVSGMVRQAEAKKDADRANAERWQDTLEDIADEMLFRAERRAADLEDGGTSKRRRPRC